MADLQRKTANLFDADTWYGAYKQADGTYQTNRNTWYTLVAKPFTNDDIGKSFCFAADVEPSSGNARFAAVINGVQINGQYTGNRCKVSFTVQTIDDKIIFDYGSGSTTITTVSNIMLNAGDTALPYEPYGWVHSLRKLGTETETIQSGDTIYANGQPISTYSIKGNTVQDGVPTPSNPIYPQGCGDLVTEGEHAGQYKIPISSAQTVNNYLGSIQSTRQIKKLVLTGDEAWLAENTDNFYDNTILDDAKKLMLVLCTHQASVYTSYVAGIENIWISASGRLNFTTTAINHDVNAFKSYLQQQYANSTPVTVWYVLATAETATVNEPLMKIGIYADSISNAVAIPTADGANSITVDTTVQPSEFTATWSGWHNAYVKEYELVDLMPQSTIDIALGQVYSPPIYIDADVDTFTLSFNYTSTNTGEALILLYDKEGGNTRYTFTPSNSGNTILIENKSIDYLRFYSARNYDISQQYAATYSNVALTHITWT